MRRRTDEPWCPGVARIPDSPQGGGRLSDHRRLVWRGVVVAAAGGAVDAGGGGAFGEAFGVGAEFVADGGVEIRRGRDGFPSRPEKGAARYREKWNLPALQARSLRVPGLVVYGRVKGFHRADGSEWERSGHSRRQSRPYRFTKSGLVPHPSDRLRQFAI